MNLKQETVILIDCGDLFEDITNAGGGGLATVAAAAAYDFTIG